MLNNFLIFIKKYIYIELILIYIFVIINNEINYFVQLFLILSLIIIFLTIKKIYKSKILTKIVLYTLFISCSLIGVYYLCFSISRIPSFINDIKLLEKTLEQEERNNKEITDLDKTILNNELNANGKDIMIILDWFEKDTHGQDVSDSLLTYFEHYLQKEIDIKIINLSFNKDEDDIEHIDLINYQEKRFDRYIKVSNESYSLDTYLKKIRELNHDSKIVLSLSLHRSNFRNDIIKYSKLYDIKIAQGYFNNGFFYVETGYNDEPIKYYFNVMFWFNFIMDTTNTIVVSTLDDKPFFWIKSISLDNLNISQKNILNMRSVSLLTPSLGYEYYLNKNSNNKEKIEYNNYFFD